MEYTMTWTMNDEIQDCPFWDDGRRFSCPKVGYECLQVPLLSPGRPFNITFIGDSLSAQHFNSISCSLWSKCRSLKLYSRNIGKTTMLSCREVCGSHVCMQSAGTNRNNQHSTAFYLNQFRSLGGFQIYNEGIWWKGTVARQKALDFLSVFKTLPREAQRRVVWRETAPQHFSTKDGTFTSNWYRHERCQPLIQNTNPWEKLTQEMEQEKCNVLRVWDLSASMWAEHLANKTQHTRSKGGFDCTHFCEPGVVDIWSSRTLIKFRELE